MLARSLELNDAVELAELLTFVADWLKAASGNLTHSLPPAAAIPPTTTTSAAPTSIARRPARPQRQ